MSSHEGPKRCQKSAKGFQSAPLPPELSLPMDRICTPDSVDVEQMDREVISDAKMTPRMLSPTTRSRKAGRYVKTHSHSGIMGESFSVPWCWHLGSKIIQVEQGPSTANPNLLRLLTGSWQRNVLTLGCR